MTGCAVGAVGAVGRGGGGGDVVRACALRGPGVGGRTLGKAQSTEHKARGAVLTAARCATGVGTREQRAADGQWGIASGEGSGMPRTRTAS